MDVCTCVPGIDMLYCAAASMVLIQTGSSYEICHVLVASDVNKAWKRDRGAPGK